MASEQAAKPDHGTIKAIIERDYSDLKRVRFIEACPVRILSLIDAAKVKAFVAKVNRILEMLGTEGSASGCLENLASVLTLYLANPLMPHGSKSCLAALTRCVEEQNRVLFNPAGLHLINPVSQALLQLEFHVIE